MDGHRFRCGFTLVELLVVMGLLGVLATVSTGGYYAITGGMEERGAIAGATSVVHAAQQRARIDRVPTALYLYNELVQQSDGDVKKAQGVAVAVRMGGRVSWVDGDLIYDEFSDLKDIYGASSEQDAKKATMRLYRMPANNGGTASKLEYSLVGATVVRDGSGERDFIAYASGDDRIPMYAFVKTGGEVAWRTGDAYAFEFATIRLPAGYFFSDGGNPTLPETASDPIKPVKVYFFDPDSVDTGLEGASGVSVYTQRPGKNGEPVLKSIGEVMDRSKLDKI